VESKKIGRPSKGERHRIPLRLPPRLAEAAKVTAASKGVTFNDMVGELLARETGVPYNLQEGLDLTA
jgi:predicted HicB family RNase H-like nuclease